MLALFGSAYVFSERGHIAVDFVARKAGAGGQRVIGVLTLSIVAVFAILVLIWGGIRVTEISWTQQVSGIPVTVGQMYLALPISGALIVFYSVFHIVKILVGREAGLPIAEDDAGASIFSSMIRDMIRQELHGDPSGRMSRDLRAMVLREVAMAITGQKPAAG